MSTRRPEGDGAARVPRFYSVAQVSEMTGISTVMLYRAIRAGEFPGVKLRGRVIVPAEAMKALAERAMAEQTVVDATSWAVPS